MTQRVDTLLDELAVLKQTLQEERKQYQTLDDKYRELEERHQTKEAEYRKLEEKHLRLVRKFFGKRSEKLTLEDESQGRLFNEAEDGRCVCEDDNRNENVPVTTVKAHERKKCGRKPLPDDLPREEIIHDISDEEKRCHCCGRSRPFIGIEESEELDIVPAKITVG